MIGYHWSPATNSTSILRHGLLVPKKHPKLTTPVTCSEGHRNPHISLGKTPYEAWDLSGGFLWIRFQEMMDLTGIQMFPEPKYWYLYQVDLDGIRYRTNGVELQVRKDIERKRVSCIASRWIDGQRG